MLITKNKELVQAICQFCGRVFTEKKEMEFIDMIGCCSTCDKIGLEINQEKGQ